MHRMLAAGSAVLAGLAPAVVSPLHARNSDARCPVPLTLPAPPADRPAYDLRVEVGRSLTSVSGSLTVTLRPRVATKRLVFRLWPNSAPYSSRGSRLTVGTVSAAGVKADARQPDPTTLVVKHPLAPGERVTVSMSWRLKLPRGSGLQLKGGHGSVRLVSFFPLLAWDGRGWATDPPLTHADSFWTTSPTADFDVHVAKPRGLRVLATGSAVGSGHWRARAVRDFALAIGSFTVVRKTVDLPRPVHVIVALERGSGYPIDGFLSETVRSLQWYAKRYGPYPWSTYSLVAMTDFAGFNGFAYPTLVFVGDGSLPLVPHETAHEWFYSLVGNDQARDPWLSEGLATWAQTGPEGSLASMVGTGMSAVAKDRIGKPMSYWDRFSFEDFRLGAYVQTVQALSALGAPSRVDCALRSYVVRNAYRTARPRDLLASLLPFFPDAKRKLSARGARF